MPMLVPNQLRVLLWLATFIGFSASFTNVYASAVLDKVYHPYVQVLEKEFEYRVIQAHKDSAVVDTLHKLGFGMALNDKWFGEVYLVADKDAGEELDVQAYEIEAKWQITEQGEYALDWGLLLELEKSHELANWETKVALLSAKEWGRLSGLLNVFLIQEWGSDIDNEFQAAASAQLRYRYKAIFEPAMEWHKSEYTHALGPVFIGALKVNSTNALFWNAGVLLGVDNKSPDYTVKVELEYEFY